MKQQIAILLTVLLLGSTAAAGAEGAAWDDGGASEPLTAAVESAVPETVNETAAGEGVPGDETGEQPQNEDETNTEGPETVDADVLEDLWVEVRPGEADTVIRPQRLRGENWLFLPASTELTEVPLGFSEESLTVTFGKAEAPVLQGEPLDLTLLYPQEPEDGVYRVAVSGEGGTSYLNIMHSAQLTALFLTSADPEKDRNWVESSETKSNKAKGRLTMVEPDGSLFYQGSLKQIKGRGNSTWREPKKPYQIKLTEAADLTGSGEATEAETTWVLLTNYSDPTLLSNQVMFDLAADLGLAYTPHCRPVDLYYDGEYRGSYLLSEKTEVGEGRVAIRDLEQAIEETNPQVEDMDDLPTVAGKNRLGNEYQYVSGLTLPKDYSGGYLLELDYPDRAREEKSWFSTSDGYYLTVKSPEYTPQEGMEYISGLFQQLENAADGGGRDPQTGKYLAQIADLPSLAAYFLIEEISYDVDAYVSSTYVYKPAGDELFYAGPVWDYDAVQGRHDPGMDYEKFFAGNTSIGQKLLQIPEFRENVRRLCRERMEPLMRHLTQGEPAEAAVRLQTMAEYADRLAKSERMNEVLWPAKAPANGYEAEVADWTATLQQHSEWLFGEVEGWDSATQIPYYMVDVSPADWFAEGFIFVHDRGIMKGVSEFFFEPYVPINRAMAATILYRIAGQPGSGGPLRYSDVPDNTWYTEAVNWASEAGIVQGYPDGTFRPDRKITREELVTLLYRYEHPQTEANEAEPAASEDTAEALVEEVADENTADSDPLAGFADAALVSGWGRDAVIWAVEQELLTGTDQGLLDPQGQALRCQTAVLIQRFLTR